MMMPPVVGSAKGVTRREAIAFAVLTLYEVAVHDAQHTTPGSPRANTHQSTAAADKHDVRVRLFAPPPPPPPTPPPTQPTTTTTQPPTTTTTTTTTTMPLPPQSSATTTTAIATATDIGGGSIEEVEEGPFSPLLRSTPQMPTATDGAVLLEEVETLLLPASTDGALELGVGVGDGSGWPMLGAVDGAVQEGGEGSLPVSPLEGPPPVSPWLQGSVAPLRLPTPTPEPLVRYELRLQLWARGDGGIGAAPAAGDCFGLTALT